MTTVDLLSRIGALWYEGFKIANAAQAARWARENAETARQAAQQDVEDVARTETEARYATLAYSALEAITAWRREKDLDAAARRVAHAAFTTHCNRSVCGCERSSQAS